MPHIDHLKKDKKLAKIISFQEKYMLAKRNNVHLHICASIISQQLSTKVAAVIYARFLTLFSKKSPSPKDIVAVPFDELFIVNLVEELGREDVVHRTKSLVLIKVELLEKR